MGTIICIILLSLGGICIGIANIINSHEINKLKKKNVQADMECLRYKQIVKSLVCQFAAENHISEYDAWVALTIASPVYDLWEDKKGKEE